MYKQHINRFFPLSSRYSEDWVKKNSLGENVLYNLESLCDLIEFNPGAKVLDLGCGKAVSSIFLANEFKAKVWAIDPKISPTANFLRVQEMGCEETVLPLRLDARQLPFPTGFFDIIIAVDSFMYYGTDREYTNYVSQFLKPGGQIGIVDICIVNKNGSHNNTNELFVRNEDLNFVHSIDWWRELWDTSGVLNVDVAEVVPENEIIIKEYIKDYRCSRKPDLLAEELEKDNGENLKIFRMAARKNQLEVSSSQYQQSIIN